MSHENLLSFPGYIFSDKTTRHRVMTENRGTCAWLYQPLTDERCSRHFIKAKCQECTGTGMARQLHKTFQSSTDSGGSGGTCLFSSTCRTPPIINISRDQTLNLWCCANTRPVCCSAHPDTFTVRDSKEAKRFLCVFFFQGTRNRQTCEPRLI